MNLFKLRARAGTRQVASDRSAALALFLLLAIVFAPILGVHAAVLAFGPTDQHAVTAPSGAGAAKPRNG